MNSLMLLKIGIAIVLSGVAVSAILFYFLDDELNKTLEEDIDRKFLEKCLGSNYANNDRKDSD